MFLLKSLASVISVGVLFVVSSPLMAATQIDLSKSPLPLPPIRPSLTAVSGAVPLPFKVIRSHTDSNHVNHVRMQQMYGDYPVWGADAVVHVPQKMGLVRATSSGLAATLRSNPSVPRNGFFYADINQDIGNADPQRFDNDAAKSKAVAVLKQTIDQSYAGRYSYSEEEAKVMIYLDEENKAHTAFLVSLLASGQTSLPKRPTAIIDAQDYSVYKQWNDMKSAGLSPALATGFGGNPVMGKREFGKDKPALAISRDNTAKVCYMQNNDVEVLRKTDLRASIPGTIVSFKCAKPRKGQTSYGEPEGGYLGQINGGYSPVNDAFHEGMVIKKLYQDWYDVAALTKRDGVTPLMLSMNLIYLPKSDNGGETYENAFWDSRTQKMYFGLGGDVFYPLVALDVAAHEISHGFTDQHSDLIYMDQSGALNEAFSDMAAVAASYYDSNEQSPDWLIGGQIMKENAGKNKDEYIAIRYINDPAADGVSIDHADKYPALQKYCKSVSKGEADRYQSCMVHKGSGVFNKIFYELATSPGWNPKSAFAVMIRANQDYWTSNANYQAAACGVKRAVADDANVKLDHPDAVGTLDRIFKDVGISIDSCA